MERRTVTIRGGLSLPYLEGGDGHRLVMIPAGTCACGTRLIQVTAMLAVGIEVRTPNVSWHGHVEVLRDGLTFIDG